MPESTIGESDFFEVIGTQRVMRRLKPDPAPVEYIKKLIWAATRGPSGSNRQGWRFIVITGPAKKKNLQEWYAEGWRKAVSSGYSGGRTDPPPDTRPQRLRSQERSVRREPGNALRRQRERYPGPRPRCPGPALGAAARHPSRRFNFRGVPIVRPPQLRAKSARDMLREAYSVERFTLAVFHR